MKRSHLIYIFTAIVVAVVLLGVVDWNMVALQVQKAIDGITVVLNLLLELAIKVLVVSAIVGLAIKAIKKPFN